ncbi:MAG: DUF5117 domain-containing protein, partial [Rhodothermales bacterium]|nr:DUF5117 domain-containing protein [Rhodothermales bacterium]
MNRLLTLCTLCAVLAAGCTTVNVTPEGASKSAAATPAAATASASAQKKSPFKPWKEVLKDTEAIDGYFKAHLKRDQTLYLELPPERLGTEFGMVMHLSRGVGVFNIHDGLPLSAMQLMKFERVGDQIYLVHVNPRFTADDGSAMKTSLEDNTGHSIVDAFKIESEDSTSKALLIDATSFFVSDYADVSEQLKWYYGQKPVMYDKGRSYLSAVQGFEKNVEIDALLTFKASSSPITTSAGVSDYRSVPVGVRYSLVALPEEPMQPRYADDRVGHFLDAVRDFSRDRETTPYLRFVNRWRLEPSDPEAFARGEKVEPKQPIVFYIDHSVPRAYRKYVKEGIEAWNRAYEAAGYKNAIVARDAPDDPAWSAEDARYSTVRWTAAHSMGYAIGPSQTD